MIRHPALNPFSFLPLIKQDLLFKDHAKQKNCLTHRGLHPVKISPLDVYKIPAAQRAQLRVNPYCNNEKFFSRTVNPEEAYIKGENGTLVHVPEVILGKNKSIQMTGTSERTVELITVHDEGRTITPSTAYRQDATGLFFTLTCVWLNPHYTAAPKEPELITNEFIVSKDQLNQLSLQKPALGQSIGDGTDVISNQKLDITTYQPCVIGPMGEKDITVRIKETKISEKEQRPTRNVLLGIKARDYAQKYSKCCNAA